MTKVQYKMQAAINAQTIQVDKLYNDLRTIAGHGRIYSRAVRVANAADQKLLAMQHELDKQG